MKQGFDTKRFFRLFYNDFVLNRKEYTWTAFTLIALTIIFFLAHILDGDTIYLKDLFVISFFFLIVLQAAYPTFIWRDFTSKKRTTSLLTLPANKSEIFSQKLIFSLILFPLIYCLYALLIMKLAVEYNHLIGIIMNWEHYKGETLFSFFSDLSDYDYREYSIFFCFWIFFGAAAFWGGTTFKKLSLFKNVAFWFIFAILLWFISILFRLFITGEYEPDILPFFIYDGGAYHDVCTIDFLPHFHLYLVAFVSLFLLIISYFKFREKTI